MNKIYLKVSLVGILLMSLISLSATAQVTGDFRTRATFTGHWSSNGTTAVWERFSNGSWASHQGAPNAAGGNTITIRSGAFVNILAGAIGSYAAGYTLVIEDNAGVTFGDATSTLVIPGDLTFDNTLGGTNGSITGNGKVQFTAPLAHNISGNGVISNLQINAGAGSVSLGLGDVLQITGVLDVATGTLNTNDGLTLKSTAAGTAAVAPVGGTINGQVNVERYFKNKRGWRMVTAPVSNIPGTIFSNWQSNPNTPTGGVEMWGVNTNEAVDGLKQAGAYSLRTYTPGSNTWAPVTNTKTAMPSNPAYLLYVSGPWNSGNIYSGSAETVTSATGNLITGTQTIPYTTSSTNRLMLVPNPYASAVDFNQVWLNNSASSNLQRMFYTMDPTIGDYGAYVLVSYDAGLNTYVAVPSSTQNTMIQSGQSIFVKGASFNTPTTVVFQENDKVTTAAANSLAVMRTNNGSVESMRINLFSANGTPALLDGAMINTHQSAYSNSYNEAEDKTKMSNTTENLFILNGTTKLMLEGRELFSNGDEVLVGMNNLTQKDYQLSIEPSNMTANGLTAILVDNFLNTQQTISLTANTTYSFTVTADPASYSANRFKIVFAAATTSVNTVAAGNVSVTAYPNPVTAEKVSLQISNLDKGTYSITVYSTLGQLMTQQTLNHAGGSVTETVNLNGLTPGTYDVKVSDNKGFETHSKIIKL